MRRSSNLIIGAILIVLGVGMSIVTDGERVFWALVAVGVFRVLRGLFASEPRLEAPSEGPEPNADVAATSKNDASPK